MRCYLFRNGHIAAVEMLTAASDEALVAQAREIFAKRETNYDGFEVWDRARLIYRSPDLPPAYRSAPLDRRSYYRLYLLGDDGVIRGYFDFAAEADDAAYEMAQLAFDACSDRVTQFELWHDSRRINPAAPALMTNETQVVNGRQANIVSLEERMRDSRWAIASSERLLARLNALKAPHASPDRETVH